ncbi:CDP-glycerol glycerophosphotransferase family protein [Flavobacterium sp. 245]|uniref:CDP-glycerol glycerophosphotransferase family protein n=1 Tax=Flavobacterium sp. 245 TaxID=2512115 RepID=UPI00105CFF8B|nr:CDP-glycerol glycerophosphotransferase family protein [Flavobacterium sp. 245]TDP02432.1 CDP-glycerol glycerophosphotransferase (TagB/SpsB family) [Flavobacterium sp. 245]
MDIKYLLKIIISPVTSSLYFISGMIPRDPKIWAFGSNNQIFSDNSKYLYIYLLNSYPSLKCVWITTKPDVFKKISERGGNVAMKWSLKGFWYALRSKYWFVSGSRPDINFYASKGATTFNLWHGIPLKKIGFDIDNGPQYNEFHSTSFIHRKIIAKDIFIAPEYFLSTSDYVSRKIFSSAFAIPLERCLSFGYPRNDIFSMNVDSIQKLVTKWESKEIDDLLNKIKSSNRTWVYMPTFRDSKPNFLVDIELNYEKINSFLIAHNHFFILKLHPLTSADTFESLKKYSNIICMNPKDDIHLLLPFCDALITDYSSIYFDFLLLDKPIYFFSYDLDEYLLQSRSMYYDYTDITPGDKILKAEDLQSLICSEVLEDNWKKRREEFKKKFFKFSDGNSSQRITDFIIQENKLNVN